MATRTAVMQPMRTATPSLLNTPPFGSRRRTFLEPQCTTFFWFVLPTTTPCTTTSRSAPESTVR